MHRLVFQSSRITKEMSVPGDVHFPPVEEGEGKDYLADKPRSPWLEQCCQQTLW